MSLEISDRRKSSKLSFNDLNVGDTVFSDRDGKLSPCLICRHRDSTTKVLLDIAFGIIYVPDNPDEKRFTLAKAKFTVEDS